MANHYLQTAFAIPVTPAEALLLKECFAVSAQLSSDFAELSSDSLQAVKTCYASLSEAFRNTFPKKPEEEDPFADFLDLWSDPGFPEFDIDLIDIRDPAHLEAHIVCDDGPHPTPWCSEGHADEDPIPAIPAADFHRVDEAEFDDIDRDFRVIDVAQGFVDVCLAHLTVLDFRDTELGQAFAKGF